MKVLVKEVSEVRRELTIVVPGDLIEEELNQAYAGIGSRAKIKGFRPGKIPRAVLEQHYRQDAENETIRNLVQRTYPEALREAGLMPVSSPEIRITAFSPLEMTFEAALEVAPVFEPKGYVGIDLEKEKTEVTEGEVDENLKALQERMTQLVPPPEPREARVGDVMTIDYQAFEGGVPIVGFQGKNFLVEIGKGYLFPEIEAALTGAKGGEKKRVPVTLPDNWTDKKLAGKRVDYEIEIKEIKEKKIPELNDDFAKDLGNFTTLAQVREKVRSDVHRAKEQAAKNRLRRQIIEKLSKENTFQVPEGMIHQELEEMWKRLEGNLRTQGMTAEKAGVRREDFLSKNHDEARFRVTGSMIFDAIGHKEGLTVGAAEVEQRIEEMARLSGQSEAVWKRYYRENNLLGRVEAAIREEKALDFVLSQSKIKVKE